MSDLQPYKAPAGEMGELYPAYFARLIRSFEDYVNAVALKLREDAGK